MNVLIMVTLTKMDRDFTSVIFCNVCAHQNLMVNILCIQIKKEL